MSEFRLGVSSRNIYFKHWSCKSTVPLKGTILAIHGINEHIKRYNDFFNLFASNGFQTFGFDMPGFGETALLNGPNDKLNNFNEIVEIIQTLFKQKLTTIDTKQLVLFGHSMGGLIGIYVLDKLSHLFDKAIIQGAALGHVQEISCMKETLGHVFARIVPSLKIATNLATNDLTRNRHEIEKYLSDPLNGSGVHLKLASEIITQSKVYRRKKLRLDKTRVLISHGSGDRMTCFKTAQEFARLNNFPFLAKIDWYHEMHFDNQHELLNDYLTFLRQ